MSSVTNQKDSVQSDRESVLNERNTSSSSLGRSVKVSVHSENELLLTMKEIFQQNVYSIDFTGITFGETFECFVQGVKQCESIQKIVLTASKLTTSEVKMIDEMASDRKGLVLIDSEGGFIGGVHTNWPLYYKTLYLDKAELKDTPELRRTPAEGIKIYKARYKRLPRKFIDIGAADGSNTIPLLLMGGKNIEALDIDHSQGVRFADKLEKYGLTSIAQKNNVKYQLCEFMNFQVDDSNRAEFLISNYVWSYRSPANFAKCWKKSVESVAEDGFLCGEFFGTPPSSPRQGITFHTLEEAITLLQTWNLEILYFEIEPHEVSLSTRKDAETIPWGDLYRIAVRKTSDEVEASSYEKVKQCLIRGGSLHKRRIFNVLENVG